MVVDLNEVMQTKKQYSDSTLNNMRKADLIKYVRQCEWNRDVAISFNQQQYRNYLQMANKPIKTNADYIRDMTDEELEEFLDDLTDNCCRCAEHQNCGNCLIGLDKETGFCDIGKWLKAEREGV